MSVHSNHMNSHFAPWSMAEVAPLSIMVMTMVVVMSMVVMVAVVVVVVVGMIMVKYMIPTSTTTGRTPQLQQLNRKYTKQQTVIKQHNEIGSVYGTAWLMLLFSKYIAIQVLLATYSTDPSSSRASPATTLPSSTTVVTRLENGFHSSSK